MNSRYNHQENFDVPGSKCLGGQMRNSLLLVLPLLLILGCGNPWDDQYEEWMKTPARYGGVEVLQKIKNVQKYGRSGISDTGDKNITDLTPFAELRNLSALGLQQNKISDLSPLAELKNLRSLALYDNRIADLTPLAGLSKLDLLALMNNIIADLTPLAGLTDLTHLHLHKNIISDLTPLAGLKNLSVLTLSYNNISDLTPLAGLTSLTELDLGKNNFTDLSPLTGLKNLNKLHLLWTDISLAQRDMLKKALPNTEIIWDY